jgi:hypothetical protein
VSPYVTVPSVESDAVSGALKFLDLDSFGSPTSSTYSRHDDSWMRLARACQHASALPSLFSPGSMLWVKLHQVRQLQQRSWTHAVRIPLCLSVRPNIPLVSSNAIFVLDSVLSCIMFYIFYTNLSFYVYRRERRKLPCVWEGTKDVSCTSSLEVLVHRLTFGQFIGRFSHLLGRTNSGR